METPRCGGAFAERVAAEDRRSSFVDGDDLLAIVNRSPQGALAPDWAPTDLVDLRTGAPLSARACEGTHCLRKEAAGALTELLAAMRSAGVAGKVESAFRSYVTQCGTFLRWAGKGSFCDATEQSALPGHSQHQLGTTLDLFTEDWAKDPRGVFRSGFGCSPGGRFLQEHAWDHGFVFPYPIHPDDRHPAQSCVTRTDLPVFINPKTGYRYEHWHLRYIGKEAAREFRTAFEASRPGTPNELTLEQWLRTKKGFTGADVDLPVCDGCNCGACATLAAPGEGVCDRRTAAGGLHLDAQGKVLASANTPRILAASLASAKLESMHSASKNKDGLRRAKVAVVEIDVPPGLSTQPPIAGLRAASYADGASYEALSPYPKTAPRGFPSLPRTWVVAIEPIPNPTNVAWPWRAALTTDDVGLVYNRANVVLPARAGTRTWRVPIPGDPNAPAHVRVTLLEGGEPRGTPIEIHEGATPATPSTPDVGSPPPSPPATPDSATLGARSPAAP